MSNLVVYLVAYALNAVIAYGNGAEHKTVMRTLQAYIAFNILPRLMGSLLMWLFAVWLDGEQCFTISCLAQWILHFAVFCNRMPDKTQSTLLRGTIIAMVGGVIATVAAAWRNVEGVIPAAILSATMVLAATAHAKREWGIKKEKGE